MPIMEVRAFVSPWARTGPCLHDEIVALVEQFSIECRIDIVRELFCTGPSNPTWYQSPLRNQVDHGQFFRQSQRVSRRGNGIADQNDLYPFGDTGQNGGFNVNN